MGHERNTHVPKSRRWRDLVVQIASFDPADSNVPRIVADTLAAVRSQLRRLQECDSVHASVAFLAALSRGAESPHEGLIAIGIPTAEESSLIQLVAAASRSLDIVDDSAEYRALAKYSVADCLTRWWASHDNRDPTLFGTSQSASELLSHAATGSGFCELARMYFSSLTDRYLRYYLEREASGAMSTLWEREAFSRSLNAHVDSISQHAFETSKIAQSFAAGWFNRNARDREPTATELRNFISHAFGKLRDELLREETQQ